MLTTLLVAAAAAAPIHLIGWNVESDGATLEVLLPTVERHSDTDVWAFSEVQGVEWATALRDTAAEATGSTWWYVLGTTGWDKRLAIVYDMDRFDRLGVQELYHVNVGGTLRAPLVVHLRERATGAELLVMVNHLSRKRGSKRWVQARMLNDWAESQTLPVVMLGDYNFDWNVDGSDHDDGYDELVADGAMSWVRPDQLVRTQCNPRYDAVLDFAFVNQVAAAWAPRSTILETRDAWCADELNSDHRPVQLVVDPAHGPEAASEVLTLRQRIEALEARVAALEQLVDEAGADEAGADEAGADESPPVPEVAPEPTP